MSSVLRSKAGQCLHHAIDSKCFKAKEPELGLQGCGFHRPRVRKPLACSPRLRSAPARRPKIPRVRFAEELYSQWKQENNNKQQQTITNNNKQQQTTTNNNLTTTYFINNSPRASDRRFSTSAAAVSQICRVRGTDTSISGPSGPSGK